MSFLYTSLDSDWLFWIFLDSAVILRKEELKSLLIINGLIFPTEKLV
ncbi:hypothetical protein RU95_GL004217 [Enterococcus avium]|nr:hypothetical protein RU95_GL004215 [Enterococcus avium]OJG14072.1 hypothetical protein RU95_GL004216 [Enterococcus avium]OJG14073.1 hypothetical protein RU95_GL004217 [Enterococcus avium]